MALEETIAGVPSRGHIIVVGAGFGGLAVTIELVRKGFTVEVIEAVKELSTQGDVIQIGSSATRVMAKWGKTLELAIAESALPKEMILFNHLGELILTAPLPAEFDGFPILFSSRGFSQKTIYDHAASIGVKFRFGARVSSYFEEGDCAGVYVGSERVQAAAVVAADGIHSEGRKYVTGKMEHPRTSGFAVYRSWFPLERLAADERTRHFTMLTEDLFQVWIGKDVHAILLINVALKGVVVFCTHKDYYEVEESWSFPGDLNEMLKVVGGWDETIQAVMRLIPPEILIDWKLLWRDPVRKWISDGGRIALLGDAAHPHLPTSGSGATQAIEGATTMATVMDKLGIDQVPLAFQAYEKLRYERTSLTQRMGWETRHRWHQTDWDLVKSNSEFLKMPQPSWLYGHDAEQYASDRVEEVVMCIKEDTTGQDTTTTSHDTPSFTFTSTNTPEGHVHEDWTVEMMLALENKQAREHFYRVANA